ncbi:MAG: GAF domain-containing protein [Candidatus Neomarinimicrobiota bacterium]
MDRDEKINQYENALDQLTAMLGPDGYALDAIGKMALICAVLKIHFPDWVFVGFYRCTGPDRLEIGPYQGDIIACGTISFDRGVCGGAASRRSTVIVPDVLEFPGYIACDNQTRSEIVVPCFSADRLIAVLDIDGATPGRFDTVDQEYLERVVALLS